MKTAKLVTGILCMVFTVFVLFQSCAAGLSNALTDNGEVSGTAGVLVALLMLAGGIVQVATRKSTGKGGPIGALILFFLAAFLGFACAGTYKDLNIWAGWCAVLGIVNLIPIFMNKGKKKEDSEN